MERFTQRARRVLSLAHQETERAGQGNIGTEHLLLGLVNEEGGIAGRVLRDLGITPDRVHEVVHLVSGTTINFDPNHIELAKETQQVLEFAVDEARLLGHHYISTEHILLALVRSECTGMKALRILGLTEDLIRRQTRHILSEIESVSKIVQQEPPHIYVWYDSKTELREKVVNFVEKNGFKSRYFDELNNSITAIQKLSNIAQQVKFAIIFVSSNDLGFDKGDSIDDNLISSQSSVYQSGFFHAKLGLSRVCLIFERNLSDKTKILFDSLDISYIIIVDQSDDWIPKLVNKMMTAGLTLI